MFDIITWCFRSYFLLVILLFFCSNSNAGVDGNRIKKRADAVLTLMSYTVVPDITASSLNIGKGTDDVNELSMTQFGGGATLSQEFPLYLEGTIGYSRFDPQFVLSDGTETRTIPTKWNSLTATGGIGWDFNILNDKWGGHLVLRPIFNFMLGTMASDVRIGTAIFQHRLSKDFQFLDGGRLNAYGLGGGVMIDYELYSKSQDIDVATCVYKWSNLHLPLVFSPH